MSPLLFYEKALAVNKVSGKIITNLIYIIPTIFTLVIQMLHNIE